MIRTEKQLTATKHKLAELEGSLARVNDGKLGKTPLKEKLYRDGLVSLIEELQEEIAEYELLSSDVCTSMQFGDFELRDFPDMLIKARLVRNMSQTDLAKLIDVESSQIQRYEATGYDGVGFERLLEIQYALDFDVKCCGSIMSNEIFMIGDFDEETISAQEMAIRETHLFNMSA